MARHALEIAVGFKVYGIMGEMNKASDRAQLK